MIWGFIPFVIITIIGVRPKSEFSNPVLLLDIACEIIRQFILQYVLCYPPLIPQNIGKKIVDDQFAKKKTTNTTTSHA